MNAGEFPEGMPAERRELILTLEELGYDNQVGVARNWRDVMPDDAMRVAIAMLDCVVASVDDDGGFSVEGEDGTVTTIDPATTDEIDFPDIGEVAAAMAEIADAADAIIKNHSAAAMPRLSSAVERCRDLQKQIVKAQEAFFHA